MMRLKYTWTMFISCIKLVCNTKGLAQKGSKWCHNNENGQDMIIVKDKVSKPLELTFDILLLNEDLWWILVKQTKRLE